jgi:hypothetical protein
MAISSLDAQIQERIAAFTSELSELVRAAALEAVSDALGSSPKIKRGPGRPRKTGVPSPIISKGARKKGGKRIRRTAADLEQLMTDIHGYLKANPGQRLEEMASGMGLNSHDMKRPIVLLLEKNQLGKKGQRRGTTYTAKGRR